MFFTFQDALFKFEVKSTETRGYAKQIKCHNFKEKNATIIG